MDTSRLASGYHFRLAGKHLRLLALTLCVLTACTGCILPRFYLDPQQPVANDPMIQPTDCPCDITVEVEFQRNGRPKLLKWTNRWMEKKVVRAIEPTGGFAEAQENSSTKSGHLNVTVNEIIKLPDITLAIAKGFVTGYTLGLIGSSVTETYEITMIYQPPNGDSITKKYKSSMYCAFGLWSTPKGKERVSTFKVWDRQFENVLADFVCDPQVQVAMAEQRRLQTNPTTYPGISAPQIATLPPTMTVQTVGLAEPQPDVLAPQSPPQQAIAH